jgi:glycosyltransferase involved in cell wall biosynthesis
MIDDKVSVDILIPTYNRDFLIENVINNVSNQTYTNYRIVVSDNCSSDLTEEKVKKQTLIHNNLFYFKNSENLGVYGNYNKALSDYCTSDYVVILSDDDFFLDNDYIKKAVNLVEKKQLDWIGSGYYILNTKNKTFKSNCRKNSFFGTGVEFMRNHKWGYDNFAWFTVLFNRKKLLAQGPFSNDLYNSDNEILFKMSLDGKCGILNEVSGVYTINSFQVNSNLTEEFMFGGYRLYLSLKQSNINEYTNEIFIKNIKNYITACFRYFIDRDAFGEMKFNDEYWFTYFKKLEGGKYFPFFDEDTQKRYKLFKKDKEEFKKQRKNTFSNTWQKIEEKEILDFIKAFY